MIEPAEKKVPYAVRSAWPALAIIALALIVLWVSAGYSEISRRFPMLVAGALLLLGLIDLYCRLKLPGHGGLNAFWGAGFEHREMAHDPPLRSEVALLLWVVAAFGGMALVGILIAAPLFTFAFVWLRSGRSLLHAAMAALVVLAFEYGVFEWTLDYELYRGLIGTEGGLSSW
jgi:hypothetical protein